MKLGGKKILSCLLAASLLATAVTGCAGEDKGDSDKKSDKSAMGRYLEEEYPLPPGVMDIAALQKLEDGNTLRMAATNQETKERGIWDSLDNGRTWEMKSVFPENIRSVDKVNVLSTAISPKGQVSAAYGSVQEEESQLGIEYINWNLETGEKLLPIKAPQEQMLSVLGIYAGGEKAKNTMQNQIMTLQYTSNGELLGSDSMGSAYLIDDNSGELLKTFQIEGSFIQQFQAVGNKLIALTEKDVQIFDLQSGDPLERDDILNEQFNGKKDAEGNSEVAVRFGGGTTGVLLSTGSEENSMYFCNDKGIYRHLLGGTVVEQMVNGSLNSLGNPSIALISMQSLNNNDFLVAVSDEEGVSKLLNYHYSKDTPSVPDLELKVYALNNNQGIRQAIALFQKENPDIFVNFEVGLTGDDAVTAADALRTLNTNMMAGKGPDVLILDGMPIESYIDKGLLSDLTNVIDASSKEVKFFEHVKNSYEIDGKIFAIPTRFGAPAIQGDEETVASSTDLKALAEQLEKLKAANPDNKYIINDEEAKSILKKLYYANSPAWIQKNGTLSEEALKEFLTLAKRIYDVNDHTNDDNAENLTSSFTVSVKGGSSIGLEGMGNGSMQIMTENILFNLGIMNSPSELSDIVSAKKAIGNGSYGWMPGQSQKVFVPMTSVGINSKSKQTESAEKFISGLLSTETQKSSQGSGFPINQAAFQEIIANPFEEGSVSLGFISSEEGDQKQMEYIWPTEEEFQQLKAELDTLDTPAVTDEIIKDCVIEQGTNCLNGGQSVDDAVKNIMQKVNLYLAE